MKPIDNRLELHKLICALDISDYGMAQEYDLECALADYFANIRARVYTYDVHNGASKFCLVPTDPNKMWVLKWALDDSCETEERLYYDACQRGIEMFFPETHYMFSYMGGVFYIQRKVDNSCYNLPYSKVQEYREIAKTSCHSKSQIWKRMEKKFDKADYGRGYDRGLNWTWANMALTIYGKKKCKALCDFIVEHEINDLHDSNIGYLNNKPIILDFCGYSGGSEW